MAVFETNQEKEILLSKFNNRDQMLMQSFMQCRVI